MILGRRSCLGRSLASVLVVTLLDATTFPDGRVLAAEQYPVVHRASLASSASPEREGTPVETLGAALKELLVLSLNEADGQRESHVGEVPSELSHNFARLRRAIGHSDKQLRVQLAYVRTQIRSHSLPPTIRRRQARLETKYRVLMRSLRHSWRDFAGSRQIGRYNGLHQLTRFLRKATRSADALLPRSEDRGLIFRPAPPRSLPLSALLRSADVQAEPSTTISPHAASGGRSAPESGDLEPTQDATFDPDLMRLADSLGHNAVSIYEYVRDRIVFLPTFGSILGAHGCFLSGECNAADTASLLIALLRISGIPCRYAHGIVEVPNELFRSAMGDFPNVRDAVTLAGSGGIPLSIVDRGGEVAAVRMRHVWVEAFIDFSPGRGGAASGRRAWVSLDASLKATHFQHPRPIDEEAGIDFDGIRDQLAATATVGDSGDSATGVNAALTKSLLVSEVDSVRRYVQEQIDARTPVAMLAGSLTNIASPSLGVLPNGLRVSVVGRATTSATLEDVERHSIDIALSGSGPFDDSQGFSTHLSLPTLSQRRLTLGYRFATPSDAATAEAFGGLLETPPYLVKLIPVLRLEGATVAEGPPVLMGTGQILRVTFREPQVDDEGTLKTSVVDAVSHQTFAGGYMAIEIDGQRVSALELQTRKTKLEAVRAQLTLEHADDKIAMDDVLGEILHQQALVYFSEIEAFERLTANRLNVREIKRPAELVAMHAPAFGSLLGTAISVVGSASTLDVRRYVVSMVSREGSTEAERRLLLATGIQGSGMEGVIYHQLLNAEAVSTVRIMELANAAGIPILSITSQNVSSAISQLALNADVVRDIKNAVGSGHQVLVPKKEVTDGTWHGVGYAVLDPVSGAGSYVISGRIAGGSTISGDHGFDRAVELAAIAVVIAAVIVSSPVVVVDLILDALVLVAAGGDIVSAFESNQMPLCEAGLNLVVAGLALIAGKLLVAILELGFTVFLGVVAWIVGILVITETLIAATDHLGADVCPPGSRVGRVATLSPRVTNVDQPGYELASVWSLT